MADRFWVGGTGNWSDATNHWSAASGGAPGASKPTSADNAIFDANSGAGSYTITLDETASCLDLNMGAAAGTPTLVRSNQISVFGNLTWKSGMGMSSNGLVVFAATSGTKTVTSNGVNGTGSYQFSGVGGAWQLLDGLSTTGATVAWNNGNLDLNGQTVTCRQWSCISAGTLSAAGSTISITTTTADTAFAGNGKTYGAVSIMLNAGISSAITGANTFSALTLLCAATAYSAFTMAADQTVSGTFTCTGNSAANRVHVQSNTQGVARTISAAVVALTNVGFSDIAAAGAAVPFSGTVIEDGLGNSGITFTTPVTRYWVGFSGGVWSSSANWSASSGGASGASVPLAQDDVIVDANSITSGGRQITIDIAWACRNLTCTGVLNAPALGFSANVTQAVYGNFALGAGMTTSSGANSVISLRGRGAQTITIAGVVVNVGQFIIDSVGGSYTLQDAYSSARLAVANGTFDDGGFSVSAIYVNLVSTSAKTVNMTGTWTLTGNDTSGLTAVWNTHAASTTINATGSTIIISDGTTNSKTFGAVGKTFGNLRFTGTGRLFLNGGNTYNEVQANQAGQVVQFLAGATHTATTWTIGGQAATAGDGRCIQSLIAGDLVSTPDSAALSFTGDRQIEFDLTPLLLGSANNVAKHAGPITTQGWQVSFVGSSVVRYQWSDGTLRQADSTVAWPYAAGVRGQLKIEHDVNNGAGGNNVRFYTRPTSADAWVQLGATVTQAFTTSVVDPTTTLQIGAVDSSFFQGLIFRFKLYDGIGGALVADMNPNDWSSGGTWVSSTTGETYTRGGVSLITHSNFVAICSSTAASHTLAKAGGGVVDLRYVSVARSTASAASTFFAHVGTDAGNNSLWTFVPTRFWVGGSGNTNDTARWSLTTGGVGGASVPTAIEDAEWDGNSNATAYTVTVNAAFACNDLWFGRAPATSGTITFAGSQLLTVSGSIKFLSGMTSSYAGRVIMAAPTGLATITSSSVPLVCAFTFQSASPSTATFRLLDNLTTSTNSTAALALATGSFDPNGKKVSLTSTGICGLTGALTFFDLERIGSTTKTVTLQTAANIAVTGTFTVTSNSNVNRVIVQSDVVGTQRTITAAAVALSHVDFMDIAGAGAASWVASVGDLGDAQGNSGITFAPSVTQTATGTASFTWSTHGWTTRVPLPQDDVVIANAFIPGRVVTMDMPRAGRNIDCSGVQNSPAFQGPTIDTSIFGSFTSHPDMTINGTGGGMTLTFRGRSVNTFTPPSAAMNAQMVVAAPGGVLMLGAAIGMGRLAVQIGEYDTNDFSHTGSQFWDLAGSLPVTVTLRNSLITLTNTDASIGRVWGMSGSNTTVNAGTSTIKFTDTSNVTKTFLGGTGKTYYNFWAACGSSRVLINSTETLNELRADPGSVLQFAGATTQTVATLTVSGAASLGGNERFVRFIGAAGGYFAGGDIAAFPTGSSAFIFDLTQDDYTPSVPPVLLSKWVDAGNQRSAIIDISAAGNLRFSFSTDGTAGNSITLTSSVALGLTDGTRKKVAATLESDGGGGSNVKFWTSDDAVAWTQLGTTQNTALPPTIFNSTAEVRIGQRADAPSNVPTTTIYRAWVTAAGLLDAKVIDFNPADYQGGGATTWVSPTGETWTINGLVAVSATNLTTLMGSGSWNITKSGGGRTQQNYISVRSSTASPTNTFYAANSLNVGSNPNWIFGAYLDLAAGAYTLAGQNADLRAGRRLAAEPGVYTLAGQAATLTKRSMPRDRIAHLKPRPTRWHLRRR